MRESYIEEQKKAKEKQNEMALAEQEKELER